MKHTRKLNEKELKEGMESRTKNIIRFYTLMLNSKKVNDGIVYKSYVEEKFRTFISRKEIDYNQLEKIILNDINDNYIGNFMDGLLKLIDFDDIYNEDIVYGLDFRLTIKSEALLSSKMNKRYLTLKFINGK